MSIEPLCALLYILSWNTWNTLDLWLAAYSPSPGLTYVVGKLLNTAQISCSFQEQIPNNTGGGIVMLKSFCSTIIPPVSFALFVGGWNGIWPLSAPFCDPLIDPHIFCRLEGVLHCISTLTAGTCSHNPLPTFSFGPSRRFNCLRFLILWAGSISFVTV